MTQACNFHCSSLSSSFSTLIFNIILNLESETSTDLQDSGGLKLSYPNIQGIYKVYHLYLATFHNAYVLLIIIHYSHNTVYTNKLKTEQNEVVKK